MDTPRLLRAQAVAALMDCSRVAVYRALEAGTMPGYKVPGIGWRVDADELRAWLEGQRNTAGPRVNRRGNATPHAPSRPRGAGLHGGERVVEKAQT